MLTKHITQFIFNSAQYNISDGNHDLLLKMDYKNNTYSIDSFGKILPQVLLEEVENIAKDLLTRKHGANFAELNAA